MSYVYQADQFAVPLIVSSYSAGDIFEMKVKYAWFNSPAPDYTVSVYSKQTLELKDSDGKTNMKHMDG